MVDNTRINAAAGSGGDLIADDEITDGGVANGAKVQRVKPGFGVDGAYTDVSDSNPLPVHVTTVSGTVAADTELPAAAALGDTTANQASPTIGSYGLVYNGTQWERARNANSAAATAGVGLPAVAALGWDGTNYQRAKADSDGTLATAARAGTAALSSVTAAAVSTALLTANTARKGAVIWNESTSVLYVALAGTASTTAYTWQVAPGGYLELPGVTYTGAISGIWSTANGSARVTELS